MGNKYAPAEMRIDVENKSIEHHIAIMSRAFDEEAGYDSDAFHGQDWVIKPIDPPSPLRFSDSENDSNGD